MWSNIFLFRQVESISALIQFYNFKLHNSYKKKQLSLFRELLNMLHMLPNSGLLLWFL